MKRICAPRSQSGFTLIELMIAMAILGIGMLTIGLAQMSAVKLAARSGHLSQAMYLAQEQMELFMVMPPGNAQFLLPVVDQPDPGGPIDIDPTDNDQTSFSRSWTIEPNTPAGGLTRITITVVWNTANSARTRVALQAVKGQ